MQHLFSPEFQLAAACAMWPPSDRRAEAIRIAAAGRLDWPRFLSVSRRHQVIGLVHDGLARVQPTAPPEIARAIRALAQASVCQNLCIARETLRLQQLFDDASVPVVVVKGAPLALLAFGNLGLRSAQDIDLLIDYETLPAATEITMRAGYCRYDPPPDISDAQLRLLMPLRKDFGFAHQATGLRIELHWRLFLNPHAIVEPSIGASSRVVPLAGAPGLRTLGDEDLFAYLCMHGALHWWNRLKWLADINALLATFPEDAIQRLVRAAEVRGTGRAATQALLLCRRLLGTPLSAALAATLYKGVTMRWLEQTALSAMTPGQGEGDPHDEPFGTTRGSLSTFLLRRSWRYRLAELNLHLTNQTDMLTLPLPERLRFLYPALRLPLWAWRHTVRATMR